MHTDILQTWDDDAGKLRGPDHEKTGSVSAFCENITPWTLGTFFGMRIEIGGSSRVIPVHLKRKNAMGRPILLCPDDILIFLSCARPGSEVF